MQLANMKLPDPLARRHLLDGELESEKALGLAQAYLADDREVEAVDFFAAANPDWNSEARDALQKLQATALERGDVFLMRVTSAALGEEPSAESWRALAESASRSGRLEDVETAERLATVGAE
jgi:hypothetical protein